MVNSQYTRRREVVGVGVRVGAEQANMRLQCGTNGATATRDGPWTTVLSRPGMGTISDLSE